MLVPRLTQRLRFERPRASLDAFGQPLPGAAAWEAVATVWAAVRPLGSSERLAAAQMQGGQTHLVTVRYSPALAAATGAWRVWLGARALGIVGLPRCPDEARQWLLFDCTERSPHV